MAQALLFRYLEAPNKMQVFIVTMDDRAIMADCKGTVHEFAVNSNDCCIDGKWRLKDVVNLTGGPKTIPAELWPTIEHMTIPWKDREFPSETANPIEKIERARMNKIGAKRQ